MTKKPAFDGELARAIAEGAPEGLIAVDGEGRIVFINARAEAMFGHARGEVIGQPIELLVPDRIKASHPAIRAAFTRQPEVLAVPPEKGLVGRRRDGTEFPIDLSLSPVRTSLGTFIVADVRAAPTRHAAEATLRQSKEDLRVTRDEATRAQRELERSAEQYRNLFEEASDAIFIADANGRYCDVNPAACAMLGYTREELLAMRIADVVPPDELVRLTRAREDLRVPGRTHLAEWMLRRKDGSLVSVEVSAKVLLDGREQAFVRDVGARRRADAALKASEEALNRAQRVARVASWDWNLETNEVVRSKQYYELFGLEPESTPAGAYENPDRVPAEDRAELHRVVDEALRTCSPYMLEHRFVRGDGEEIIVRQQGEPIVEGGRAVRMTGTLLDITDLRRAERDQEKSLRWLRAVFDQCPMGILIVQDGHVEANRHAQMLLGRPVAPVGFYPEMLVGPDGQTLAIEDWPSNRVRRGERVEGLELCLRQPDGNLVPLLVSAAPLIGSTGELEGVVLVGQDVTVAKQLERLRAEWASIVAHDLRQPLNAINLSCLLLSSGTTDDAEIRGAVERIVLSAKRLSRMVHDIMDLSRLEAARLDLSRRPVDLLAVAKASVEEAALDPANPPIELRSRTAVPRVSGDPDRLMQVMTNLLSNASKYGRAGAPILVDVASSGREVSVAITNDGEGIAPADVPRLFQRFERAENARQSGIRGVGLGLHITRGLIEAHGGRIEVESTPGATTTFRFTLPAE